MLAASSFSAGQFALGGAAGIPIGALGAVLALRTAKKKEEREQA